MIFWLHLPSKKSLQKNLQKIRQVQTASQQRHRANHVHAKHTEEMTSWRFIVANTRTSPSSDLTIWVECDTLERRLQNQGECKPLARSQALIPVGTICCCVFWRGLWKSISLNQNMSARQESLTMQWYLMSCLTGDYKLSAWFLKCDTVVKGSEGIAQGMKREKQQHFAKVMTAREGKAREHSSASSKHIHLLGCGQP